MQPIKNRLVPSMLAAGANRKIAAITFFFQKLFVQLQRFIYSIGFLIFFSLSLPPAIIISSKG